MKRQFSFPNIKTGWLTLLALALSACVDLKLQVGDAVNKDENFASEQEFLVALIPVYHVLQTTVNLPQFELAELSTDELMVPTRGADWYDGGVYVELYQHTWNSNNYLFEEAWQELYIGQARANKVLDELNNFPNNFAAKNQIRAELRCLRAYFNFRLMDYYGNVPVMSGYDFDPLNLPAQTSRPQLFNDIETDLLSAIPDLPVAGDYGRFSRGAAQALLAKLYLNAEVYTGQPRWQECRQLCDEVINSGQYSLLPDYFDNFVHNNDQLAEQEILLAAVFDPDVNPGIGNNLHMRTLHYSAQSQFNLQSQPWNGYCTAADFYNSFDNTDIRKTAFLEGPQTNPDNSPVIDFATGLQVNYTPLVGDIHNAARDAGVRVLKYPPQPGAAPNLHNDVPILRYADVLLMQAEASIRLGDQNAALNTINIIRSRAGLALLPLLNLNDVLAERGRELFWETWRRNDMIRFGTFCNARDQKQVTPDCNIRGLYPIPLKQINASPVWVQNPGY